MWILHITYLNVLLLLTLHFYGCESSMEIVWGLFWVQLASSPAPAVTSHLHPSRYVGGRSPVKGRHLSTSLVWGFLGQATPYSISWDRAARQRGSIIKRQIMNFVRTTVRKHSILRLTNCLPLAELLVFFICYYLCMICFVFILEGSPAFFISIVALECSFLLTWGEWLSFLNIKLLSFTFCYGLLRVGGVWVEREREFFCACSVGVCIGLIWSGRQLSTVGGSRDRDKWGSRQAVWGCYRCSGQLGGPRGVWECVRVCVSACAPAMRHTKRKNMPTAMVEGCKAGRLEGPISHHCRKRKWCRSIRVWLQWCVQHHHCKSGKQILPRKKLNLFLQQTKSIKGQNIEKYFPDKLLFLSSARHIVKKIKPHPIWPVKRFLNWKTNDKSQKRTWFLTMMDVLILFLSLFLPVLCLSMESFRVGTLNVKGARVAEKRGFGVWHSKEEKYGCHVFTRNAQWWALKLTGTKCVWGAGARGPEWSCSGGGGGPPVLQVIQSCISGGGECRKREMSFSKSMFW